jgi:hypothetical protein
LIRAYHGTKHLSAILESGLLVPPYTRGCAIGHVCLTDRPAIAAALAYGGSDPGIVEVDLSGLDLPEEGFVGSEMRIHHDISCERLTVYLEPVTPSMYGHVDPGHTPEGQHPTCLRLLAAARANE